MIQAPVTILWGLLICVMIYGTMFFIKRNWFEKQNTIICISGAICGLITAMTSYVLIIWYLATHVLWV